jgi:uncharacterized protein with HEPN domain
MRSLEEFTKVFSFDDFFKDAKAMRAVGMDFMISGGAAKHVPLEVRKRYLAMYVST